MIRNRQSQPLVREKNSGKFSRKPSFITCRMDGGVCKPENPASRDSGFHVPAASSAAGAENNLCMNRHGAEQYEQGPARDPRRTSCGASAGPSEHDHCDGSGAFIIFLCFIREANNQPRFSLPGPRSKRASRIFLIRDTGRVFARIISRVPVLAGEPRPGDITPGNEVLPDLCPG
jgi:hypothetical protein